MTQPSSSLNLLTDIPGVRVGHAHDAGLASGVTAIVFEHGAVASVSIQGGAPGVRDTAMLEPDMIVTRIDGIVLSGGSTFGLDAAGGVQAWMRENGIGQRFGPALIPLAPQAILFDLANGGNKDWGRFPPYRDLGFAAAAAARTGAFELGTVGAGHGATTVNLKGGLGSASTMTPRGFRVAAIAAVNAVGSATIGDGPHFWAAPYEVGAEFGGRGQPARVPAEALRLWIKGGPPPSASPPSTTIALVVTDAALDKAQCKRLAIAANDGLARALRPAHAPMDGDTVFAAATGEKDLEAPIYDLTEIGLAAADCLARAIACGVHEATALPFAGALPSWKDRWG
jgi:D-aminopeptidase